MNMDNWLSLFVSLIAAVVLWRLVLSVALACAVAVACSWAFPATPPFFLLVIVLMGIAAGLVWQTRHADLPGDATASRISRPVAMLGLSFTGLFWGGLVELATHSTAATLAVLAVSPFLASPLVSMLTRSPLAPRHLLAASLALCSGYAALALAAHACPHMVAGQQAAGLNPR